VGQSRGSTLSGPFEDGFYAGQVAFPGRPLIPAELSDVSVIRFETKLEALWGHNDLHCAQGWPYIVGRGYVNY